MSQRPFRFVHASDFHLEVPVHGLTDLPQHLRDRLLDAPLRAVARLVDAALDQQVDFLVLAGDLVHPQQAGPRTLLALIEQFERLAEREIPVYWAGGAVDSPDRWPPGFALPSNVFTFSSARAEETFVRDRDGGPLARIVGWSLPGRGPIPAAKFQIDPSELFTIAVAHGTCDRAALSERGVDYWALGGEHQRQTPAASPCVIHYPGSVQGRSPAEPGTHGGTLVEVESSGATPRLKFLPSDVLRFLPESITVDEQTTTVELQRLMTQRAHDAAVAHPGADLILGWTLSGRGPVITHVRRQDSADDLLAPVRQQFGYRTPAVWSVSPEVEGLPTWPAEWSRQDTLLGEFLRALRRQRQALADEAGRGSDVGEALSAWGDLDAPARPISDAEPAAAVSVAGVDDAERAVRSVWDLAPYLPERLRDGRLAERLMLEDPARREQVLQQAARLGLDLLSPGEHDG
jgi:hypothetical protein